MINTDNIVFGKIGEEETAYIRPRRRWKNNIKIES
jgi:hypothetical protein